ncbi:MAG: D-alanyl-D-alanine carboxypeptidase family protein [Bacillota bacterium]|nr:D-alanyl-D-alanine carboxypeptidase family protein [Bacillota bacterium]
MKKLAGKLICLCICMLLSISTISGVVKAAPEGGNNPSGETKGNINVDASSAILIEPNSGKVIFEKNSHQKFAPASVTKIMTMLISMERIDSGKMKLSDKVTASENAKKMGGSSMLLDTGEVRTVEELLKGIAIASGNDAAVAMAEYIGGSEEAFVKLMNDEAQRIGMKDTQFKNCTGLSAEGHLTTAYDISLMSRELLKHPQILKYTGTYMETISEGRKSPIGLVNHNKLVRFFKGCDGLKTGFTDEAKYCISATATRDGIRMLAVIMGAPSFKVRNRDASMLLNYGFSKYESKKVLTKDMDIEKINIDKKGEKYYIVKASADLNVVMEKGEEGKITKKCFLDDNVKGFKKGEIIGFCEVYLNGKPCGKIQVYCDRDVKKMGLWDNFKSSISKVFDGGI